MKSKTIRIIVLFAIISVVGIIAIQIFLMQQAFDLKEKQFNQTATIALQNAAEKVLSYDNQQIPLAGLVTQVSSNYFVIMLNSEIETTVLEFLLKNELEKRKLLMDFEYGVYNCQSGNMVYGNYVSFRNHVYQSEKRELPVWKNDQYYIVVLFPDKDSNLISQLGVWLFLCAVLLLVCVFFGYSIFVILKQKRLWEIQKDFINNMTHEFKTPLSTILVSSELLRKSEINQSQQQILNYTSIIQNETFRLKNQVEQVLKVALLDKDKTKLILEQVSVNECISTAERSIKLLINQKNGIININLNATNYWVKADLLHLTNVFFNLLDNALKYTTQQPEINITTENYKNNIIVTFKDNGIGIDKKNLRKIFDKFYRVPTGNIHDVKGFGLGLFYVKSILKTFKGSILVDSQVNAGSVFKVMLPVQKQ